MALILGLEFRRVTNATSLVALKERGHGGSVARACRANPAAFQSNVTHLQTAKFVHSSPFVRPSVTVRSSFAQVIITFGAKQRGQFCTLQLTVFLGRGCEFKARMALILGSEFRSLDSVELVEAATLWHGSETEVGICWSGLPRHQSWQLSRGCLRP